MFCLLIQPFTGIPFITRHTTDPSFPHSHHLFHVNFQSELPHNNAPIMLLPKRLTAPEPVLRKQTIHLCPFCTFICVYTLRAQNRELPQLVPSLIAVFPSHYELLTSDCFLVTRTSAYTYTLTCYLRYPTRIERRVEQRASSWDLILNLHRGINIDFLF
jgi:hypothetical protein